ncbi:MULTISPECIES: tripartite tricarboxylate transporter TctB family protein [Sporomusa]|jgi:putative tricarboxylic transport membrane protein|uniref:Tripartite tricarboxylate transporter TctB family protein n=2 Tax=Sporomusa TaxID=2375 RepID=A0ABM9W377_9FIRM|nr:MULTISPECIES: tripartite tricarboxylate transporter TctB family protein [Sporomusa]OLS55005.1 tripartite tricarboxylate transporter TctB family protein [Sporomusa sphaeroides DSM 2875]CVK19451.1 Tripartite tricarboxylate transporter TctB family protein [Sporomusa sphaeroides DSM 2875]SCM78375.1 conserved membrane hypothetical protein [uncultured Sporomusa sp.]HML32412.1 tripartite tricarboxylate transporter TctB family protein [Sporomusa sphaeroides]
MTKQERMAGLLLVLLGMAVVYYGFSVLTVGTIQEPGPGFFPAICGTGIVILSVIWFITSLKTEACAAPLWEKGAWLSPLIAVILIAVYASIMEILGYILATIVFLIAWQQAIEREKWLKTGIIAIVGTTVMYVLFAYLLGVPLPEGILIAD